jgi:hypothetical protein
MIEIKQFEPGYDLLLDAVAVALDKSINGTWGRRERSHNLIVALAGEGLTITRVDAPE